MRSVIILSLFSSTAFAVTANVPPQLSVQGVLRDGQGGLESGSFQFTIKVWDAETAGNTLWVQTQAAVPVESGFFTLILGQADGTSPNPLETIANLVETEAGPLWVGVQVQGDPLELTRIALNAVPYAFVADHATSVDNFGGINATAISNVFGGSQGSKCTGNNVIQAIDASGNVTCATGGANYSAAAGGGVTVGATTIGLTGLNTSGCTNGQVLTWNTAGNWSCTTASAGAIYSAGSGINISAGNQISLPQSGCTVGQVLKTDGAGVWTCQGDNNNTYTAAAGSGINIAGTAVALLNGCANGNVPTFNGATWGCATPAGTIYSAGTGLNLTGTTFSYNACTATGQVPIGNGAGGFACGTPTGTTYNGVANEGVQTNGSTGFELIQSCSNGQVLKYATPANTWGCAADNGATYTATAPVNVTGTVISLATDASLTVTANQLSAVPAENAVYTKLSSTANPCAAGSFVSGISAAGVVTCSGAVAGTETGDGKTINVTGGVVSIQPTITGPIASTSTIDFSGATSTKLNIKTVISGTGANKETANCAAGTVLISGGCDANGVNDTGNTNRVTTSCPYNQANARCIIAGDVANAWHCDSSAATTVAYALCL